jgi:hypothetical protein
VTGRALNRYNAWPAGFLTPVPCRTWRATGITIYLENDGRLEHEGTLCPMLHYEQWRREVVILDISLLGSVAPILRFPDSSLRLLPGAQARTFIRRRVIATASEGGMLTPMGNNIARREARPDQ